MRFFGAFVPTDLQHNGNGFNNKQATHDDEDKFLADDDGNGTERRAKRECADVAHKDLCRIGVKPQKAETRATHGGTENYHFVCAGERKAIAGIGQIGSDRWHKQRWQDRRQQVQRGNAAKPSKPSVRLTALDVPTMVR